MIMKFGISKRKMMVVILLTDLRLNRRAAIWTLCYSNRTPETGVPYWCARYRQNSYVPFVLMPESYRALMTWKVSTRNWRLSGLPRTVRSRQRLALALIKKRYGSASVVTNGRLLSVAVSKGPGVPTAPTISFFQASTTWRRCFRMWRRNGRPGTFRSFRLK